MKSLFVNGQWEVGGDKSFDSINPADKSIVWQGNYASIQQVDSALLAATNSFNKWSHSSYEDRLAILKKYIDLLGRDKETFAKLISDETGKPIWEALTEVGAMMGKLNHCLNSYQERCPSKNVELADSSSVLRFKAIGVMAVFGPFNLPGHLPNGHILPALLAGNTVVFKPSEQTPAVGVKLIELLVEAGLPDGVVNLVQGSVAVGKALCSSPLTNGVLFTGSYNVGRQIHKSLAGRPEVMLALEMGGNNPLVVWDVKDKKAAAYLAIQSAFITSGQRCVCARKIVLPQGPEGDNFLSEFIEQARKLSIGKPSLTPEPFMGPLISNKAGEDLLKAQSELESLGAKILLESKALDGNKALVTPGILDCTGLDLDDEEVFGPLVRIVRVESFDEAVFESNKTRFGLASGLVSDSQELYDQFISESKAGIVNWNRQITGAVSSNPFGGVGASGNYRPSAYFAADYCAYPVASIEKATIDIPSSTPPGLNL